MVTFAYTASLFTIFESLIQSVMMPMKETIFDNFFSLTAVIVAVISIIMLERGKQHAFYRTVVCVVSIYAISFMFYAAPMTAVKYTKVVVDSMNNKFIQSSYSVTFKNDLQGRYSDDAVLTLLNNQIWEAFIGRIWTDLEIGEKGLVDPYRDRLINAVPGSMDRENIYKELSEKRTVGRPSRGGGAIFFLFSCDNTTSFAGLSIRRCWTCWKCDDDAYDPHIIPHIPDINTSRPRHKNTLYLDA